jgi:hypothetical protein
MKGFSERLSSLTFTTLILIVLVFWLTWGILMAGSSGSTNPFVAMNQRLVRDWLIDPQGGSDLLKFWFGGLCVVVAFLGVNLVFCSWNKILRIMRVKFSGSKLLMLVVHLVFGLVALGHFGSFMLGYRYEKVLLGEGQSFSFGDGHAVQVKHVRFVDDPAILKKSPRDLTGDEFHYRQNFADIVLSQQGAEVTRDRVSVLEPARHEGVQITLARFVPSKGTKGSGGQASPRVMFVITRNPLLPAFLVAYGIMIAGISVYLAMTWRKPGLKNNR